MKFLDQEEPNNRRELSFKNGEWYHPRGVMIIIIFESQIDHHHFMIEAISFLSKRI